MATLQAGTIQTLKVVQEAPFGYFLSNGKDNILLHISQATEELEIDDDVEVFIYHDKQGRFAASMNIPEITLDSYGWAKVVEIKKKMGVFVDIGIDKDILVSIDDLPQLQHIWPKKEDMLYISLKTDKKGRLLGKLATDEVIRAEALFATEELFNKNISGYIYRSGSVGSYMYSDVGYRCFIHENEQVQEPRLGQYVQGRVIDVKEDGSLNVSLLPRKHESIDDDADTILEFLQLNDGFMPYGDKSSPEDIKEHFGMSKSQFKRALGRLLKEKKVIQNEKGTFIKQ